VATKEVEDTGSSDESSEFDDKLWISILYETT